MREEELYDVILAPLVTEKPHGIGKQSGVFKSDERNETGHQGSR